MKSWYFQENLTHKKVDYGHVNFSLNSGDYIKPKKTATRNFRIINQ